MKGSSSTVFDGDDRSTRGAVEVHDRCPQEIYLKKDKEK